MSATLADTTPPEKLPEIDLEAFAESTGDAYRDTVLRLAKDDSPYIFSNGLPEHAAIIFEVFFLKAAKNVNIFCHNLNPKVFASELLIGAIEKALTRGVEVNILSQDAPLDSAFSRRMAEWASKFKFRSKVASDHGYVKTINENFATMDSKAFRFEYSRDKGKASASMNEPSVAEKFNELFEKLFSAA